MLGMLNLTTSKALPNNLPVALRTRVQKVHPSTKSDKHYTTSTSTSATLKKTRITIKRLETTMALKALLLLMKDRLELSRPLRKKILEPTKMNTLR